MALHSFTVELFFRKVQRRRCSAEQDRYRGPPLHTRHGQQATLRPSVRRPFAIRYAM
jgi:hypothetical protein